MFDCLDSFVCYPCAFVIWKIKSHVILSNHIFINYTSHGEGATEDSRVGEWGRRHGTIMGDYRIDRLFDLVKITS